jgi:hypothetical protein
LVGSTAEISCWRLEGRLAAGGWRLAPEKKRAGGWSWNWWPYSSRKAGGWRLAPEKKRAGGVGIGGLIRLRKAYEYCA